jgi:hypothetical protein
MAIKIIYYSEVIDNFGRQESSMKGSILFSVLNDVDNFTDDMTFEDDKGNNYSIDELIGQEVELADIGIFTVPGDEE